MNTVFLAYITCPEVLAYFFCSNTNADRKQYILQESTFNKTVINTSKALVQH